MTEIAIVFAIIFERREKLLKFTLLAAIETYRVKTYVVALLYRLKRNFFHIVIIFFVLSYC